METLLIKVNIISNEWYFTYKDNKVVTPPTFVDSSSSAIIGENVNVEFANTEQELLDKIKKLNLEIN